MVIMDTLQTPRPEPRLPVIHQKQPVAKKRKYDPDDTVYEDLEESADGPST